MLYFSTIGKASCFLLNTTGKLVEITDRNDIPKEWSFISSGEVAQ